MLDAAPSPEAPTLELPDLELDRGEDSREVDVGVIELSLGGELDLDDAQDAVDPFEVGLQEQDDAGSDEPANELEIGMAELLGELPDEPASRASRDSEAPVAPDGDLDSLLDAPIEADETSTEAELGDDGLEDLPELIRDEQDGPDLERPYLPGAPEGRIPIVERLEPEWLSLGAPSTALWHGEGHTLAAAEHLMWFGSERKSHDLPPGTFTSALCLEATGKAVLATSRGLVEVSPTGAVSVLEVPEQARGSGAAIAQLVGSRNGTALWARLTNGMLMRRRRETWERHEAFGTVSSLTGQAQNIALLVVATRPTLQISSDGGTSFREQLLPEPAATVAMGAAPQALALGSVLAVADLERGLSVSGDGGETFRMVVGAVNVTAIAVGEWRGQSRVIAALYRESRDVTEIVVVEPDAGQAVSVAELRGESDGDAEESGRTSALVLADGDLWAAGGYGLARIKA